MRSGFRRVPEVNGNLKLGLEVVPNAPRRANSGTNKCPNKVWWQGEQDGIPTRKRRRLHCSRKGGVPRRMDDDKEDTLSDKGMNRERVQSLEGTRRYCFPGKTVSEHPVRQEKKV